MMKKLEARFTQKLAASDRNHPVYILPTADGFKVLALNFLLLIMGLVYANNYVLLFNFILFCLCLCSMFYSHYNLNKLKLLQLHIDSLYDQEWSLCKLHFKGNQHGHFSIHSKIIGENIELNPLSTFNISDNATTIELKIRGLKRGRGHIMAIQVETSFPLHFFRCFTYFKINRDVLIHPERINLGLHKETQVHAHENESDDEFSYRLYQLGDSMKQLDWKKYAKSDEKLLKTYNTQEKSVVLLSVDENQNIENSLKSLSFAIHKLYSSQSMYGIKVGDSLEVSPDRSQKHFKHCMDLLATYES